jgi:phage major head subunit gpT-like protein
MIVTQETLDDLRVTFSDIFQSAYDTAPTPLEELSVEVGSSGRQNVYGWLAQQLVMRKWLGARQIQSLSEHSFTATNERFEATVELPLDDIADDILGTYRSVAMPQLGVATKTHPEVLMGAMLLGVEPEDFGTAKTYLTYDGLALFHDAHPTFYKSETFDNNLALALDATNLKAAISAMGLIKGEDGRPFGVRPTHLIVPRALEWTARELLTNATVIEVFGSNTAAAAKENLLKGSVKLIIADILNGNDNAWYLADCSKPLKPIIKQVREGAEFTTLDSLTDPEVFRKRRALYGATWRGTVCPSLPHLILKSDPS